MVMHFLSYERAAAALERGENPYLAPAASRAIWRSFHATESELLSAHRRGEGEEALREVLSRPFTPGPYQYPPTLALLIAQLGFSGLLFVMLTICAVGGFRLALDEKHRCASGLAATPSLVAGRQRLDPRWLCRNRAALHCASSRPPDVGRSIACRRPAGGVCPIDQTVLLAPFRAPSLAPALQPDDQTGILANHKHQ